MKKSGIIGGIVIALVLIFGLITAITCLERVPTGYVGVVYNMSGGVFLPKDGIWSLPPRR